MELTAWGWPCERCHVGALTTMYLLAFCFTSLYFSPYHLPQFMSLGVSIIRKKERKKERGRKGKRVLHLFPRS